jgi:ATP-binding cassette, subfamily B, bacterial
MMKSPRQAGSLIRALRDGRPCWPHLGGLLGLSLLAAPISLLVPVPLKIAVDSVLGSHPIPGFLDAILPAAVTGSDTAMLVSLGVLFVLIAVLNQLQELASLVLGTYTGERLLVGFRARLFRHVQRLSLSYHDAKGVTDTTYRIQYDASNLRDVVDALFPLLSAGAIFAGMLYVVSVINWQLALVAFGVTPIIVLAARAYGRRLRAQWHDAQQFESKGFSVVHESLAALRVVTAFGQEQREEQRFTHRAHQGLRSRLRLAGLQGRFALVAGTATALGTAAVLIVGTTQVQSGAITLGQLLLVMAYLSLLYQPLESVGRKVGDLQEAVTGLERAYSLLDKDPDVVERADARPLAHAVGRVGFDRVWFGYGDDPPVIEDASFDVRPGAFIGVVGTTGAGKTTLAGLLPRFYEPRSGRVLLDGVDVRDYRLADLRRQFAIVLQEPVLFSTTIAENIAYARPEAAPDEIAAAARAANAHRFVEALPDGYETLVGERGMRLSGGERQRISLARAFLRDAPVLVLDEPTSAVDLTTERAIAEAMHRLVEGRTTFLITHRVSMLEGVDEVMRVEGGRVAMLPSPERMSAASVMG